MSEVYKIEFSPAKQTASGPNVTARLDTCWTCDKPIMTFDEARYLICEECFENYHPPDAGNMVER